MTLDAIARDTPAIGGKAAGLALAKRLGLAVPPGLVIPWTTAAMSGELAGALARATAGRGPWIVRSSASVEDTADHAAPGVFLTRRDVAPADVPAAVEAVWASAGGPTARAYLAARGLPGARMAVIVQEQVPGTGGTAYSRAPGDPGRVLVEQGERLAAVGETIVGDAGIPPAALVELAAAARLLETALGGPADVEWVLGERLWVVQARRVAATAAKAQAISAGELAAALAFSRAAPDAVWTWDAAHNPAPLSAAQAGLVALVEAADAAAVRQRVVLGYLYATRTGASPPDRLIAAEDLEAVYAAEIAPAFERDLARMGGDLEETLAAYTSFYRRYSRTLAPSVAGARGVSLRMAEVPLADVAPAWDVAAPTYAERALAPAARLGRLADIDDVAFARAQAGVRRALVGVARRVGLADEDVTDLPLAEVREAALSGRAPHDAAARAAAQRMEIRRLAAFAPPFVISGGTAIFRPPGDAGVLRGHGTGGRARGSVLKLDAHLARAAAPMANAVLRSAQGLGTSRVPALRATRLGRVLVVATIIPPMAPLLQGALAVVAEHGGILGHGAALARELGVPCVVGCVGALTALTDGDEVWVDADAGVVLRLSL